jgi:hypothetical protein
MPRSDTHEPDASFAVSMAINNIDSLHSTRGNVVQSKRLTDTEQHPSLARIWWARMDSNHHCIRSLPGYSREPYQFSHLPFKINELTQKGKGIGGIYIPNGPFRRQVEKNKEAELCG